MPHHTGKSKELNEHLDDDGKVIKGYKQNSEGKWYWSQGPMGSPDSPDSHVPSENPRVKRMRSDYDLSQIQNSECKSQQSKPISE